MKVLDDPVFLAVHRRPNDKRRIIHIVPLQETSLKKWGPSSRISPIFRIEGFGNTSPDKYNFKGKKTVFFIGPVHPDLVLSNLNRTAKVWFSIGLFNIIVVPRANEIMTFRKWLEGKQGKFSWEIWEVKDGIVCNQILCANSRISFNWPMIALSDKNENLPSVLREAIAEYGPLMSSTITRSDSIFSELGDELSGLSQFYKEMLHGLSQQKDKDIPYQALDLLLTINAGLSRLASQTFAGSSPILERECHFWSNSLLGIGIATLALRNIRLFVEKTLGEARIPERFLLMSRKSENKIDLSDCIPPDKDFLAEVDPQEIGTEPLCPLITYFSARDGWRGTSTTISAPLAAVTSCNSVRWSLVTLTHEFSHIVIRAILTDLYPEYSKSEDVQAFKELWIKHQQGDTLLEEIKRILLFSILDMAQAATGETPNINNDQNNELLKYVLRKWHPFVEETMVHVFDFIYFYGKDVQKYIAGIWASWGTIPNVTSRIEDYVVRSLSAVLSTHWRRGDNAEDLAVEDVTRSLTNLNDSGFGGRYVDDALTIIEEHWKDRLKRKVRARRQLVKIVSTYLFSKEIATSIRGESEISGGTRETEGYTLHPYYIEDKKIRNPLVFTEIYTKQAKPSPAWSLWMYYTLCFCIRSDEI